MYEDPHLSDDPTVPAIWGDVKSQPRLVLDLAERQERIKECPEWLDEHFDFVDGHVHFQGDSEPIACDAIAWPIGCFQVWETGDSYRYTFIIAVWRPRAPLTLHFMGAGAVDRDGNAHRPNVSDYVGILRKLGVELLTSKNPEGVRHYLAYFYQAGRDGMTVDGGVPPDYLAAQFLNVLGDHTGTAYYPERVTPQGLPTGTPSWRCTNG